MSLLSHSASGFQYVVDVWVKDTLLDFPFNAPLGVNINGTNNFTLNGKPEASFTSELESCGTFTFTNTSISGEQVDGSLCPEIPNTNIEWAILADGIVADPSNYIIQNGTLNPGTSSLNVEFEPGIYDIVISLGKNDVEKRLGKIGF